MLSDDDLDLIFREARSYSSWQDRAVSDVTLQAIYDLMRWCPTAANCCPARVVFVHSDEARERLKPHLDAGNVEKGMTAPVTAIIGHDLHFYDQLPKLFPHNPDARGWFSGDPSHAGTTAFRNGTLQGAYLMIAARALGLDCGPMSGFDNQGVDETFFPDGDVKSNFICALGYGTRDKLFPRSPRLEFDEACRIV